MSAQLSVLEEANCMLRITRNRIMNKIQNFLMSLCKLSVCLDPSVWCAALVSLCLRKKIYYSLEMVLRVSKNDQKYGEASSQEASEQHKTSSARKSNSERDSTVIGRRENSHSPSIPKHFLNETMKDKFKTHKGRPIFTRLRTELGNSVKFLNDKHENDQKETTRSQKEKSTKAYKIQRLQKATKFQKINWGEVLFYVCSQLHLFPNVCFWLPPEFLAGLDGPFFRQIMSIFL